MPVKPRRFTAKLSYRGQPFASVPIEVSTVEAGNADHFDTLTSDALGLVGVPATVAVPCMTLPWQIAQKLHAATAVLENPKVNDRAHDLVDLQLLEGRCPIPISCRRAARAWRYSKRVPNTLGRRELPRCRTGRRSTQARWKGLTTLNWPGRSTRPPRQCSDLLRGSMGWRIDECRRGELHMT
jgi:hypothetical protein